MAENGQTTGTFRIKSGMAQMLKGGVIRDVVTAEQAKIAEEPGRWRWSGCPRTSGAGWCGEDGRPGEGCGDPGVRLHPGNGGGAHGPSLDNGGTVELSRAAWGTAQVAWGKPRWRLEAERAA